MSRFGGGVKCPVCGKTVYMAEEVLAEGNKYHKMCFKCANCSKMLETTNVTTHGNEIYCKSCHTREFGIKGYGYGGGAGTLASESADGGGECVCVCVWACMMHVCLVVLLLGFILDRS